MLNIDKLWPDHGWLRVRKEQANDPEFAKIRELWPLENGDGKGKTALYVGASRWRNFYLDDILLAGYTTDLVEIDPENCRAVSGWYAGDVRNVYCSDIRDFVIKDYDLVAFIHVLEHVTEVDADRLVHQCQATCGSILVACPVEQKILDGEAYGNVAESHLWSVPRGFFAQRGFDEQPTGSDRVASLWCAECVPSADP